MDDGVEGDVALILTIDATGTVTDVEVEAGLPDGITESAVAAARSARFQPARDAQARPTPVRLRWLIRFTLPERRTPAAPPATRPPGAMSASPPVTPAPAPAAATPPPGVPPGGLPQSGGPPAAGGERPGVPVPPAPTGPVEHFNAGPPAILAVRVREKGTGKDLPTATLFIEDTGDLVHLDEAAGAERALTAGAYVVIVSAPGHHQEERIERLHAGERLQRTYFIQKERLNQFETVVRVPPPRPETGVVTLQAEEIHNIPGTFGDPFRTAMLLPGVGSILSGLGYPVIRGESPGQTGTFIDDVRVPLLYHLGFGPAVVHPLYLESLDFHPGNFPAEFGRFTGAFIQAHTTEPATERQTMLSADLFKFSAFHTQPLTVAEHEASVTASARYGTFAFLARAINPRSVLEYWDYQVRGDLKLASGDLRLLVFGAQDRAGTSAGLDEAGNMVQENLLTLGFHRMALRYRGRLGRVQLEAGLESGPDYTNSTGDPDQQYTDALRLDEWIGRPHVVGTIPLGDKLKLRAGADLLAQKWNVHIGDVDVPGALAESLFPRWGLSPSAFLQADWQPSARWLIPPRRARRLLPLSARGGDPRAGGRRPSHRRALPGPPRVVRQGRLRAIPVAAPVPRAVAGARGLRARPRPEPVLPGLGRRRDDPALASQLRRPSLFHQDAARDRVRADGQHPQ